MERSREEFIVFIREAMQDSSSGAFEELYRFLISCYIQADTSMSGKVTEDDFDDLIESAAALPRLYGFAPKSSLMYHSEEERKAARSALLNDMDTDKNGQITLEEWLTFALSHTAEKVYGLPKDYLGDTNKLVTKAEFIDFMKRAVDKSTPEFRELYFFLVKTFKKGDKNHCGAVGPMSFDLMIEAAAAAPRRFGLAPSTDTMFPNSQARYAKRKEYFDQMDTDRSGTISLNEWIDYAFKHIFDKVALIK